MFGLTIPIQFYIYAALSLAAVGGIGYGKYQSVKYDAYVSKVEAIAATQEAKNQFTVKQQNFINQATKESYETKLSALKSYYGGLRQPSGISMSVLPNSTLGINGEATNLQLACAYTTQQLVSLQDWILQQSEIK
jgi:hypothetical protein